MIVDLPSFELAKQSIQIQLQSAKLAVMNNRPAIYQASLAQAALELEKHFKDQTSFSMISTELTDLANMELIVQLPQLLQTIDLFQQYIYQLDAVQSLQDNPSNNLELNQQN